MSPRSEMLGNRPIGGKEALRVSCGFQPLHAPLALAGGLVRILRAVIEIAVLTMLCEGRAAVRRFPWTTRACYTLRRSLRMMDTPGWLCVPASQPGGSDSTLSS